MRIRSLIFLPLVFLVALSATAKEKPKPGKNPSWPPKAGIRTPGIQIAFDQLKAEAEITLPSAPSWLMAEGMAATAFQRTSGEITRITNRDNKAQEAWKGVEEPCGGAVQAFGNLWVPDCKKQSIARLDPRSGKVAATAQSGVGNVLPALAASGDSVWVLSDAKGTLARVDPDTNTIVSELRLDPSCNGVYFEQASIWVICSSRNHLLKINPKTNLVDKRIETAEQPLAMAFGEGHLWVLGGKAGKVSKIDPKTDKVVATVETGVADAKGSIAFGEGFVWVSQTGYPLTKIDAKNDKVVQQFVGESGHVARFGLGSVWLLDEANKKVLRFDPKRIAATLPE